MARSATRCGKSLFTATIGPNCPSEPTWRPRYTSAMPPVPRREVRRYGPNQTGVCSDTAAKAYENEAPFPSGHGLQIEAKACPSLPHRTLATKCASGGEPAKHRLECARMRGEKPNEAAAQSGAPRNRKHRARRPGVAPKQAGEGPGVRDERISSGAASERVGKDLAQGT